MAEKMDGETAFRLSTVIFDGALRLMQTDRFTSWEQAVAVSWNMFMRIGTILGEKFDVSVAPPDAD